MIKHRKIILVRKTSKENPRSRPHTCLCLCLRLCLHLQHKVYAFVHTYVYAHNTKSMCLLHTSTTTFIIKKINVQNATNIVHCVQIQRSYDNTTCNAKGLVTLSQWFKRENAGNSLHDISRHTYKTYTHFAYVFIHTFCISKAYIHYTCI